ncbi:MAG: ArsR/SmtB family transcription factor, partial [Acidimicrobiales bacterium]
MDPVFKALADPTRRDLLDVLFETDGQSLSALVDRFEMTRIGVAKHLGVLEAAGLVVTRRSGRQKLHYLNPVPIRLIHDRWISKYAEPVVGSMTALKRHLEEPAMTAAHVYSIHIRTTPESLWRAITDG